MSSAQILSGPDIWGQLDDPRTVVHGMYDEIGGPLYADFCVSDRSEIAEFVSAVRRTRGEVLELAAGAGRLTFPLLAAGRTVVATELSTTMLGLLRERLDRSPRTLQDRCEVIGADMRTIALHRTFGAIVLGTTSISLLSPAERAETFVRVREHLVTGGAFLLTTLDLGETGRAEDRAEYEMYDSAGELYLLAERVSADRMSREVALAPRRPNDDGSVAFVCRSTVAVLSVADLTREATQAGLSLVSVERCEGSGDRYLSHLLTFTTGATP